MEALVSLPRGWYTLSVLRERWRVQNDKIEFHSGSAELIKLVEDITTLELYIAKAIQ